MKFNSFFYVFASVFLFSNAIVEAFFGLPPPLGDVTNVLTNNIDSVQLPVKYPLPALGTTACSTYPHADVGVKNFKKLCYTQLYLNPETNYPYKCRTNYFTVGVPLLNVPFDIPTPVDFIPLTGFYIQQYVSKVNKSQTFFYNTSFVEVQKAESIHYVTNGVNLTLVIDSVITHYTDKGYVLFVCPLTNLNKPLCASPSSVFLCTYAQFPNASDVSALSTPLDAYPFYVGKNLLPMDQTGC